MTQQPGITPPVSYLRPIYRCAEDGVIRIYSGDLLVSHDSGTFTHMGELELRLSPRSTFVAHLVGTDPRVINLLEAEIEVPASASLKAPTASQLPERPGKVTWANRSIRVNNLVAGDLSAAKRLLIHISGHLSDHPLPFCATDEGEQEQLEFTLPGWQLRLARVDDSRGDEDFSFVVEAVPDTLPITHEVVTELNWRIFIVLGFIAGRELGVGSTVALDSTDSIVWAEWGAPRQGAGQWRWCQDHMVNDALPRIAAGYSALVADPAMEKVASRTIGLLLAANGRQVLDVRIPVACSGLELLSWAIMQQRQWLNKDTLDKMSAGPQVRLLLHWAGIPVDLPIDFTALEARRRASHPADWVAPDLVFKIRNDLVHPPKKLDSLVWPSPRELDEAWRLAMQYLELGLLRLLEYDGNYFPRLDLKARWVTHTEPVPWA